MVTDVARSTRRQVWTKKDIWRLPSDVGPLNGTEQNPTSRPQGHIRLRLKRPRPLQKLFYNELYGESKEEYICVLVRTVVTGGVFFCC